ncbi:MAG: HAD-IIIC family phosphatase [Spirochaetales bacterium]|nr:HAD-IIIC family phosphatase [Spirochaetales bacterium]
MDIENRGIILNNINSIIEEKAGMKFETQSNFLDLGGNSIVAAQIIGEINQIYGVDLQVSAMLDAVNIGGFIDTAIEEVLTNGTLDTDDALNKNRDTDEKDNKWPLTSDQERIWFLDKINPKNPAFNIYVALRIKGKFNYEILNQSVNYLLSRHKLLRARFVMEEGRIYQIVEALENIVVPVEDINEAEINEKLMNEASIGMDILKGNLIKTKVFQLNENDRILFMNIHHIISDAWSLGILMDDLMKKYSMIASGYDGEIDKLTYDYLDFIHHQAGILEKNKKNQVDFWKDNLKDVPTQINLPYDLKRPEVLTYRAGHIRFELKSELVDLLKTITKEYKVTIFNFLYSSFTALLYKISNQKEFLIGCPIANRKLSDFNKIVGFFTNTLVMKNKFSPDLSFTEEMKQNHETSNNAFSNSDVPFIDIVKNVSDTREYNYNPLFQIMFSLLQSAEFPVTEETTIEYVDLFSGYSDYDIFLTMEVGAHSIKGSFNYSKDVFLDDTAQSIISGFVTIIEQIIKKPDILIDELAITDDLQKIVENFNIRNHKQQIVISSTFSDQPIKDIVSFWMNKLDLPSSVLLADYNTVFNQLLDTQQLMMKNNDGVNIILVRLEDWVRYKSGEKKEEIVSICDQFISSLEKAINSFSVPVILSVLPSSKNSPLIADDVVESLTDKIITTFEHNNKIHILKTEEIYSHYPMDDIFDEVTDKQGHMPFTVDFYKALSTAIARKIYGIKKQPFKVIILDCDNTLWKGVVAEDGIENIEIDPPRVLFQKLMVEQQQKGMLLCLVSKNEESDVLKVFQEKTGMILKENHIVRIKANWQPKSHNIKEIASELNLGLDSIIFVDDNPVECAEVSGALPQVLTIPFPVDPEGINDLIIHGWFWDHLTISETDKNRTAMYKEEMTRKNEIAKHITFEEFYNSLQLEIDIQDIKEEDIQRVSQLTIRTNQFNTTKIVRTENDISQFLSDEKNKCLAVSVSDRFGSYGLVGAVFCTLSEKELKVDSLILSCRTLGKGVEHRMLNKISEIAIQHNVDQILIPFYTTDRNRPVLNFLTGIECQNKEKLENGDLFYYSAKQMIDLKFDPSANDKVGEQEEKKEIIYKSKRRVDNKILLEIVNKYSQIKNININSSTLKRFKNSNAKPENEVQEKIISLAKEVLHIEDIGIDVNFFELGGYSIQLVQLLSVIQKEFECTIEITDLFQYTNIRKLADYLTHGESDRKLKETKKRGEMQRQRLLNLKRK